MLPTPYLKDLDYDKVYEPSEDSFLLLDCFEEEIDFLRNKYQGQTPIITEIGSGSGIVTSFIMNNILQNGFFLATDINPNACISTNNTIKLNGGKSGVSDAIQMSLTGGILPNKIDLMVFNPPYVPGEEVPKIPQLDDDRDWLDLALVGGSDGMEVTWIVLDQLDKILSPLGVAYILFCARNKPDNVKDIMKQRGWMVETVIQRKAGWEVLSILRFEK